MESELLFSFRFIHEILVNGVTVIDDSISFILDGSFFILGDALKVSDIQMSTFDSFLCTILPDMRSKNFTARSENNVSTSVMSAKLLTTCRINTNMSILAL
jgi:hypothetical protein